MHLHWPTGGACVARTLKIDVFDNALILSIADRTFIRYVEQIPPHTTLELTHRRSTDQNIVTMEWVTENPTGSNRSRGRVAFFNLSPAIINRFLIDSPTEGTV